MKRLLTIAGSDSGGGAGIQADIKTFSALGAFGMSAITAVTAQNTQTVAAIQDISPEVIAAQIDAVFTDIGVDAVKIGMVSCLDSIYTVSERMRFYHPANLVIDPVMVSTSGCSLLASDARQALRQELLPLATILTPNIPEAEVLADMKIDRPADMERAAHTISGGRTSVLVKGGHLDDAAVDVLVTPEGSRQFIARRVATKNTHGTGCTLSSAIAVFLAEGQPVDKAVENAKKYITTAISHAEDIGHGSGPVNHFYALYSKAGFQFS